MNRYELCFELGNSGVYIAPELLPANPKAHEPIEPDGRMTFIYQFEFMPAGLLTRFIVKIHKLIVEELFWKYGVIVAADGAKASIIADEQKRQIRIDIEGSTENKKALLAIIRRDFGDIFDDFNRKVRYDELVH
jgi:internalin A